MGLVYNVLFYLLILNVGLGSSLPSGTTKSNPDIENAIDDEPIANTTVGLLKGTFMKNMEGETFYAFLRIPYAEPPIGELRFKAPVPKEPWEGVRDATADGSKCIQYNILVPTQIIGKEDCLYMNVFTKNMPNDSDVDEDNLKPVLFWIHGGGFKLGTGSREVIGPEFIMTEDIVLVSFNYRLNIFGFMSFEAPEVGIPGNAAMKDIVTALKWTKDNIAAFGGNPSHIIAAGLSAGGASAHLLALSPLSRDLLKGVIVSSASALCPWVITTPDSKRLYRALRADNKTLAMAVFDTVNSLPPKELLQIQDLLVEEEERALGSWSQMTVVIEPPSDDAFLSQHPEDIIRSGDFAHVPIVFGFVSDEGGIQLSRSASPVVKQNFTDVDKLVPADMRIRRGTELSKKVGERIKDFYWGDLTPSEETWRNYIDFQTDVVFMEKIVRTAKLHAEMSTGPVYFYNFNWLTDLNFISMLIGLDQPIVSHGDDLAYLFTNRLIGVVNIEPDSPESKGIHQIKTFWNSFINNGNFDIPEEVRKNDSLVDIEWKPMTKDEFNYAVLQPEPKVDKNPLHARMQFWEKLYDDVRNDRI